MKRVLIIIIFILLALFGYRYCNDQRDKDILQENSALIQEQIRNVGKLVVTEGHFSQVYNFSNSKDVLGPMFTAGKKALVVVNAEVTVAYDLSEIKYEIDEESKTLYIKSIPEEEIKINPDFEYYDVTSDFFNPFDEDDYNKIKKSVNKSLQKKVEASSLKTNAKNRLISELSKFYILTSSMGWTLVYEDKRIGTAEELETIKL